MTTKQAGPLPDAATGQSSPPGSCHGIRPQTHHPAVISLKPQKEIWIMKEHLKGNPQSPFIQDITDVTLNEQDGQPSVGGDYSVLYPSQKTCFKHRQEE